MFHMYELSRLEDIAELGKPEEILTRRLQCNRYTRSAILNIPATLVRKCRLSHKDLMKFEVQEDESQGPKLIISKARIS